MGRLIGPDEASREVKAIVGGIFRSKGGRPAQLWADAAASVPADVLTLDGAAVPQQQPAGNGGRGMAPTVTIDTSSFLPLVQYPPGDVELIYGTCDGGPAWPMYARTDDRLDALGGRVGTVEGAAAALDTRLGRAEVGVFNVRAYGAVGDGVADDTAAILAATTAAHAGLRGVIYLPAGRYKMTAPWSVNTHRVSIVGAGPQSTTIVPTGLAAGQYALTLGWTNTTEPDDRPEPFEAIRGVSFAGPTGAGQANCLYLNNAATATSRAHSLGFREVGFEGFDVQVDLGSGVYLASFDRCFFSNPQTYGVRMSQVTLSGENIAFRSCIFAGGPGTMVFLDQTGSSFYFAHCSFDYCGRAVWQRAGQMSFVQCHFETGTTYGGVGKEYLLLDRRGLVNRPLMTVTDCEFYDGWDNYDTAIRLRGDNGDQALRVVNPYIRTSATMCQYFIRDDGPVASNILVTGAWYGQAGWPPPKLRVFGGDEWPISARASYAGRPTRTLRRASPNVVEPFPAWGARGSEALTSGRLYMVLFRPEEEITLSKIAFYTGGTAASGLTLAKVALYQGDSVQMNLRAQSASDTTVAAATNTRYELPLSAPYRCQVDGLNYALAVLFVGTTMPALVTAGNNNFGLLRDATYGHPAGLMVSGQTDVVGPMFSGSWASPDRLPYLVGSM